jgi:uncharacterized protein YybS (DUF2232 family)
MQLVRTRSTVEGALLAAVTALLGVLAFYTGFGWLQPLPVLLAYLRHGPRSAVLVSVVASAVLALWVGPLAALGSLGFVAALGLAAGWAVRRGWSAVAAVGLMTLALLALGGAGVAAAEAVWHQNLWTQTWREFADFVRAHGAMLQQAGITPDALIQTVATVIPAAAVMAAAAQSAAIYGLSAVILGRLGHPLPRTPAFRTWRMPPWLAWPYLAVLAMSVAGARLHNKVLTSLAWNLVLALGVAYALAGVAAGYAWLRDRGLSRGRAAAVLIGVGWVLSALGLAVAVPVGGLVASQLGVRPASGAPGDGGNAG